MPHRTSHRCAHASCRELTTKTYCPRHMPKKTWTDNREPAHKRGYDAAWHKLRNAYLKAHPQCELCGAKATMVHHVISVEAMPELRLSWDNLQSMCRLCHEAHHGRARDT